MYIWCCISVAWADSKNSVEYHLAWTDSGVVISGRVLYLVAGGPWGSIEWDI